MITTSQLFYFKQVLILKLFHINNGASRLVFISFMIITSIKNGGDRDVRSYIESDEKVCIKMNTLSHASGVCAVISRCCQPLKRKGKTYV